MKLIGIFALLFLAVVIPSKSSTSKTFSSEYYQYLEAAKQKEPFCRKLITESFDRQDKECKRLIENYTNEDGLILPGIDERTRRIWFSCPWKYGFAPTSKIPNLETFRELAIEVEVVKCMTVPNL
jgi:hypothetical protein